MLLSQLRRQRKPKWLNNRNKMVAVKWPMHFLHKITSLILLSISNQKSSFYLIYVMYFKMLLAKFDEDHFITIPRPGAAKCLLILIHRTETAQTCGTTLFGTVKGRNLRFSRLDLRQSYESVETVLNHETMNQLGIEW